MTTKPRPDRAQQQLLRGFLKQQSQPAAGLLRFSIALGMFNALLMIVGAYLLAQIIHLVMFEKAELQDVQMLIWYLGFTVLARGGFLTFSQRYSAQAARKIKSMMRSNLLTKLTELGPSYVDRKGQGAMLNIVHDGVEALHDYYANYLTSAAYSALVPMAILIVVLPTDWQAGLIFLFTAPLIPFFMILVGHKAEQLNQERWQQLAVLGNYFFDRIRGLTQLKLFDATRRELKQIAKVSDDFRHATLSVLKVAFLSSFALEFLATISVALVAVIIGFRLFFGSLDFATGFVVLLLAPEFYLPLRKLGNHYHARLEGISAARDMLDILNEKPAKTAEGQASTSSAKLATLSDQSPVPFTLSVNNLSYVYPNSNEGVHDINLALPDKGIVAFVGASGSGKSTLFDCLLGFHPEVITNLSINNKSLTIADIANLQRHLAWIPQRPTLFYTSIKENICIGKADASDQEVELAAHQAGALDFIKALPNGFETIIGEQGEGLSGGQKQRIALARAFLKRAPILALDEPTAHLDSITENTVQNAINDYAQHNLVLVIAHRLTTLKDAKNIIVIDQGRIVQMGNYKTLSTEQGPFLNLLNYAHSDTEFAVDEQSLDKQNALKAGHNE